MGASEGSASPANPDRPEWLEGAVYENAAYGPYGTWVSARILWDRFDHNADLSLYPGDTLRVRVVGARAEWYKDTLFVSGAADKEVSVGKSFDKEVDIDILIDIVPGLHEIRFGLAPKEGTLELAIYDENENLATSRRATLYADSTRIASLASGTHPLVQGTYRLVFDPGENAPPPVEFTLTPGRKLRVEGHYASGTFSASVKEDGAPELLPAVAAVLRVCVVPYRPKFAVLCYPCTAQRENCGFDIRSAVLVRYDGNRFDPENENRVSLEERAVADGLSISGAALWPLRASRRQPQLLDNYPRDTDAELTMVADCGGENVTSGLTFLINNDRFGRFGVAYREKADVYEVRCCQSSFWHSGKKWYTPPKFFLVLYPGDRVTVLAHCSVNADNLGWYTVEVASGDPSLQRIFASEPPFGPFDQFYRRDGEGNILYYEKGDVVVYDSGAPKQLAAYMSPTAYTSHTIKFRADYRLPENLSEDVYPEKSGHTYVSGIWLEDLTLRDTTRLNDTLIYTFDPLRFDENSRYRKLLLSLPTDARNWMKLAKGGQLSYSLTFWSVANRGVTFDARAEWTEFGLRQAVEVTAWRLAPWARETENAQVLYLDNAWEVDDRVGFELTFTPVGGGENFLLLAREASQELGIDREQLKEALENLIPLVPSNLRPLLDTSWLDRIGSFAELDDHMLEIFTADTGLDNTDPQYLSGAGRVLGSVERRGAPYFAVEENAWLGENAAGRVEMVSLPFDDSVYRFDINLSGEGMLVELASDTPREFTLRVHAPPRSGGIRGIRLLDNENNELYSCGWLWLSEALLGQQSSPITLSFYKSPSTPARLYAELTNAWGAKRVQEITLTPWSYVVKERPVSWTWVFAALIFALAWVSFINWLKLRREPGSEI